jgi:HEAT repeat protein
MADDNRSRYEQSLRLVAVSAACLLLAMSIARAQDVNRENARLIQSLKDKNPSVRVSAADTLGQIRPIAKETVPALVTVLSEDTDVGVRTSAAMSLARFGPGAKEAVPALIIALRKDTDPNLRLYIVLILGQIGPGAVPALVTALSKDTDADLRSGAADALGQIGPGAKGAVPVLITALSKDKDTDADVRVHAAIALGEIGPGAKEAVPVLITALSKDADADVRVSAAFTLGRVGPSAKEAVPALITALSKDTVAAVRSSAATTLGQIGPDAKEAVPALVTALSKDTVAAVRSSAATALGQIGPNAKEAVPALITALSEDTVAAVRSSAATALGQIGPNAKEAVPALITALSEDTVATVRNSAAIALGQIGPNAKEALPALITALSKDTDADVRSSAAAALVRIAEAARDNQQTELIKQLTQAEQALKAGSFVEDANKVQTAVDILLAIRPPWYERLYAKLGQHSPIVTLAAAYFLFTLLSLTLLWKFPFTLWRINEFSLLSRNVKLPDWLGGGEASLAHVLVVGFFHFHPRVLDSWVSRHIAASRNQFSRIPTVQERDVHIEVPAELDRKAISGLKPEDLREGFARNSTCLLIWGEGGAGKTSMACQVAYWAMADEAAMRPCAQRMLPVLIEQDLNLEVGKDKVVLAEVIRGRLKDLTGQNETPDQELIRHLLKRKRVLVIVDGLSELSEATRHKVRPLDPEFAPNALIVTSRVEETLDGITKTILHPVRIKGNRLSSFMDAYLVRRGNRELFDDAEFFNCCSKFSGMVGDRDTTVLLAKLYAEQMIASKEGARESLPENIPELMLQYLNELNRKEAAMDDRAVHAAAKAVAWECMRQAYRPTPAKIEAVLEALGGGTAAQDQIDHLDRKLRLIQLMGVGRDQVKFALDPLAEYLAGLYLVDRNRDNDGLWRGFLAQAEAAAEAPEAIKDFLLAVRDCCLVKGPEADVPSFVANELAKQAGLDLGDGSTREG